MLMKTIEYVDYNGVERKEDFYFNFDQAELLEWELSIDGGLTGLTKKIITTYDQPTLVKLFKELILKSYGEKSPDGKRFVKSDELSTAFSQTKAYSKLFMELATDAQAGADFINGLTEGIEVQKMSPEMKKLQEQIREM